MLKTTRTVALTIASLIVSPAMACISQKVRGQTVLLAYPTETPKAMLPREYTIKAGDLVPVHVPVGAKVSVVDQHNVNSDVVVRLHPDRYKTLAEQGGGRIPMDVRILQLSMMEWLYFGGANPGVAYIVIQNGEEHALLRLHVQEVPEVTRGQVLAWNESKQDQPIYMTQFDTLDIDLPGRPGDGWQVAADVDAANILSLTHLNSDKPDAPARVRIRMNLKPKASQQALQIRNGSTTYRFTLHAQGVPAC